MPAAGAIIPPQVIPLRQATPGFPSNHIDTETYVELETESPECKIYFTTDGSKPNPIQMKIAKREVTFKYRGPFTLKPGKRTLKVMAVSRDSLQESNVVTRTFVVEEIEEIIRDSDQIVDSMFQSTGETSELESIDSYRPKKSMERPRTSTTKKKKSLRKITGPKEAWATTTADYIKPVVPMSPYEPPVPEHMSNSVQMPDSSSPVNYSGTQINFWGCAPNIDPGNWLKQTQGQQQGLYGNPYPGQMGSLTNKMIQGLEGPKISMEELKRLYANQQQSPPQWVDPQYKANSEGQGRRTIAFDDTPIHRDAPLSSQSLGNGDWREQLKHIHAHLIEECKNDLVFRKNVAEPKLGKVIHADFEEEDNAFVLTVSIAKIGRRPKPKTQPTTVAVQKTVKKTPPPSPAPAPAPKLLKTVKTVAAVQKVVKKQPEKPPEKPKEKPKLVPEPKKKDLTKEDPYFVQEDYENAQQTKKKRSYVKVLKASKKLDKSKQDNEQEQNGEETAQKPEKNPYIDPYFQTEEYEADGTLKPWPAFNSERDCERLRKAMKGMGTDETAIVDILGYRSSVQREDICKMFKTMFGKDLRDELAGETSGNFQRALKALCLSACDYDAYEINRAIKGLGTDEDALIEILCTRTNSQIQNMKPVYERLYGRTLEDDVADDTSGNFKRVLMSQIAGSRSESLEYDLTAAKQDAQSLYDAGEAKWGTDESKFNEILCNRSFAHLRAVFEQYKTVSKKDIEDAIKSEFSGDIKNSLLTIVRVIKDKPAYFAKKMQKAMKGLGTDDEAMVRVVITRCECDMVQIKESFQQQFNGTLASWIADDTSGDYKEILQALIGDRIGPAVTAEEKAEAEEEQEMEEIEEEHIVEEGTLKPAEPFDAKHDCEVMRKAMKGLGTDEDALIGVLAHRSNAQRQELVAAYATMYGKDLVKELKSETSGNFKTVLAGLCMSPAHFDCDQLKKAMKGLGTDEDCLVEILCTRTNAEMETIVKTYKDMYGKSLEDDIVDDTSGHLKRILVSMVQANRPDTGNTINRTKARKDAKDLNEAGEKKFGTDESRFNVILCSRSYPQLRATFQEYQKTFGKDIEQVIKDEMSGDLKKAMLTIVRCIRDKSAQFAKSLYDAMHGLGTNDESLIRTIVTRCEVDMVQIKEKFERAYKGSLGEWIRDDTSGDYRKTLLNLVGDGALAKK